MLAYGGDLFCDERRVSAREHLLAEEFGERGLLFTYELDHLLVDPRLHALFHQCLHCIANQRVILTL